MIVNGEGMILGRLCSLTAELLLKGEDIVIVNAEKVVLSGNKKDILDRYKQKRGRKDHANPRKGPMFPRTPDGIVRRTVRGMVNYRSDRGTRAFRRLRIYTGVPEQYSGSKLVMLDKADSKKLHGKITTVGEVSRELGYKW